MEIVAALAGQGAAACGNAVLFCGVRRLATIDGVTGLADRRHFTEFASTSCAPHGATTGRCSP